MVGPASIFTRLVSAFRLLALRSDIDDIILELLGQFSLEKIYADGDKETYQNLVITLLAQLNAIFNVQRLTLPSEGLQVGWYLGFLASWEVTLRTIEFVLQVVVEGRESLWESQLLREKYLAVGKPNPSADRSRQERATVTNTFGRNSYLMHSGS
jgi:hypothetical protein